MFNVVHSFDYHIFHALIDVGRMQSNKVNNIFIKKINKVNNILYQKKNEVN